MVSVEILLGVGSVIQVSALPFQLILHQVKSLKAESLIKTKRRFKVCLFLKGDFHPDLEETFQRHLFVPGLTLYFTQATKWAGFEMDEIHFFSNIFFRWLGQLILIINA